MIPFKYSHGVANNSNIDVRDTIILCQKAYYNFSVFRNTIDLMTEFSISDLYYTGGSKKSREFFEISKLFEMSKKFETTKKFKKVRKLFIILKPSDTLRMLTMLKLLEVLSMSKAFKDTSDC